MRHCCCANVKKKSQMAFRSWGLMHYNSIGRDVASLDVCDCVQACMWIYRRSIIALMYYLKWQEVGGCAHTHVQWKTFRVRESLPYDNVLESGLSSGSGGLGCWVQSNSEHHDAVDVPVSVCVCGRILLWYEWLKDQSLDVVHDSFSWGLLILFIVFGVIDFLFIC